MHFQQLSLAGPGSNPVCSFIDRVPLINISDADDGGVVHEPLPMLATVKEEPPESAPAETVQQSSSNTMGYVLDYVRAAFEALFGSRFEAQVAAVAALPPNWNQPADGQVSAQYTHYYSVNSPGRLLSNRGLSL